jgi:simple sugar transport system permease protein
LARIAPIEIGAFTLQLGRVHYGIVIGIVAAALIWLILARTKWGLEIKVIGENPQAARYAGMDIARNIILVMLISGGFAGLAGFSQVAGVAHRLQNGIAVGDGFTAIIVAWLAKLNPWAIILVSVLMAGLTTGGDQLQISMGLPAAVSGVLQGSILFFVLGANVFVNYRLRVIRPQPAAAPSTYSDKPEPAG